MIHPEGGRSQRETGDEEQVISLQWPSPTYPLSRLDYMTLCNNTEIIEVPLFPIDPIIQYISTVLPFNNKFIII